MNKILAFIPARGGSKGIPNKNIKLFNGKPLIEWTIDSALKSKLISKVIVSSDSQKILSISKKLGAETVLRPKNISGDFATTESAIKHYIKNTKESFDTIVLLSPTSPIRKINDIDNAIKEFKSKKLDSCFSASILLDFLIWKLNKKKKYESINYNFQNRGTRQKRDLNYVENGSIYVFKTKLIKYHDNRIAGKIGIYLMNFWQSFEIDVKDDWKFLETIQKTYIKK
ncbi:acylneuraminate cytidylyltransferase family protein [Candidatus Pelagibacter sp.]|nr:acylneuraminate cytidylyltransferase family protein [Candidatus Pelagibacter sp.]MDC3395890.1 acylneuraminate cytidylyltransferase family protein [Candidatus Pelagibacter sp.]